MELYRDCYCGDLCVVVTDEMFGSQLYMYLCPQLETELDCS